MNERYQVGQKVWLIGMHKSWIDSGAKIACGFWSVANIDMMNVSKIFFREATITESVPVSGEYDDEKKHIGFMAETDGIKLHNQFPVARYGQLSNTADYSFKMADLNEQYIQFKEPEDSKSKLAEFSDYMYEKYGMDLVMQDLETVLDDLYDCFIVDEKQPAPARKALFDRIVEQFEKETGLKIVEKKDYIDDICIRNFKIEK